MTVGELKEFLSHRDDDEKVLVIREDWLFEVEALGDDLHGIVYLEAKERYE